MRVSPLHVDGVIYLVQSTTSPPPAGPVWLVILLASITAVVTIAVATVPLLTKRLELRHRPPDHPSPAVDGSVDIVTEALRDAHRERDEAQDRAERLAVELGDVRVSLARALAQLEHLDPHRRE